MKLFRIVGLSSMALLMLASVLVLGMSATSAQDGGENIPTPSPFPVEDDAVAYDLSTVGGEDVTLTFDTSIEQDGITVGETSVESNYPRGMVFSVPVSSDNGDIMDGLLFIRKPTGDMQRFPGGSYDAETGIFTVKPWETGEGQPAWLNFDFFWRFRDVEDVSVDTPEANTDYWDPGREWYRVESDYIIAYWFGFEEVEPEYVAENITIAMNATEPRRIEGFGGPLSYKPIGVIYPTREALGEITGSGTSNANAAGYTSSDLGMTVQHISVPTEDWFERQSECIYLTPREERTEQRRVNRTIYGTIPHEVAHLYQYDKSVSVGPNWWVEGQADYFTYRQGNFDSRLRYLSSLQDISALTGNISAFTYEADGCYALAYDMGVSFINFTLTNNGGIQTHAQIVELLQRNIVLADALEEATGKTFDELENEWRTYLGYQAFSAEDRDPSLALVEAVDPVYVEGDSITPPGPRPLTLYPAPGPGQIPLSGSCFAGIPATVLRVGNLDGVNYYELDCSGIIGWAEESSLPNP